MCLSVFFLKNTLWSIWTGACISVDKGQSPRLSPRAFLLGVQKSGTTDLFFHLTHDSLEVVPGQALEGEPKFFSKEPHFFDLVCVH